jgi:hypothetical protein
MTYPLALDLAAPGAPIKVLVVVTCWVLDFSKQAFYKWKKNPLTARDWDDAHLINAALDIHLNDPALGIVSSLMNSLILKSRPVNDGDLPPVSEFETITFLIEQGQLHHYLLRRPSVSLPNFSHFAGAWNMRLRR